MTHRTSKGLVAGLVVAACVGGSLALSARTAAEEDFRGIVVEQHGEILRYPASERWSLESKAGIGYTIASGKRRVSYWGTFRAEEVDAESDPPRDGWDLSAPGWAVTQEGKSLTFPASAWRGNLTPEGLFLERQGRRVMFYGTFRAEERR